MASSTETCAICLDTLDPSQVKSGNLGKVSKTPCNHLFHRDCLVNWFENGDPGNYCPFCKTELNLGEVFLELIPRLTRARARSESHLDFVRRLSLSVPSTATTPRAQRQLDNFLEQARNLRVEGLERQREEALRERERLERQREQVRRQFKEAQKEYRKLQRQLKAKQQQLRREKAKRQRLQNRQNQRLRNQ